MSDKALTFPFAVMLIISFVGIISGNTIFGNTDILTIATLMAFTVGAAVVLVTVGGATFLGSGVNSVSLSVAFQSGALTAIWGALTLTTSNFLIMNGAIGGMIWGFLTIVYTIGVVLHIRGGASI